MRKTITVWALILVMILLMPFKTFASAPLLNDDAHLVKKKDAAEIEKQLESIRKRTGESVVIVTKETLSGRQPAEFADTYFDENGYGPDGILLLVVKDSREWQISTAGKGITAFTDEGQKYLMGEVLPKMKKGEYGEAFKTYATWSEKFIQEAEKGKPFDVGHMPKKKPGVKWFFIDLLIGLGVFGIIGKVKASKMITIREKNTAGDYVREGSILYTMKTDRFIRRSTSSRRIEKASSGGSSTRDSGHGGSGGKF